MTKRTRAKAISVTISPLAQYHLLEARRSGNRSATLSAIVERYGRICERCMPELSEAELALCRAALSGLDLLGDRPCNWALAELERSAQLGQAAHLEQGGQALLRRLRTLDEAGWTALVDDAERYWRMQAHREEIENLGGPC